LNSLNGSIHRDCAQTKDNTAAERGSFVAGDPLDHARVCSAPSRVGSDLTTSDFFELESRWIDRVRALQAGLRRVDSLMAGEIVGRKSGNNAGILIPYFHPGSDQVREY